MPIGTTIIGGGYGGFTIGTGSIVSSDSAIGTDQGIILLISSDSGTSVDDGDWAIPVSDADTATGADIGGYGILRIDFDLGYSVDQVGLIHVLTGDLARGVDGLETIDTGTGLVLVSDFDQGTLFEGLPLVPLNPIINGNFESGLTGWTIDSSSPAPTTSTTEVFTGTSSLLLGTPGTSGAEPTGDSALHQTFMVPTVSPLLVMDVWQESTDSIRFDWQEAQIRDIGGTMLTQLFFECLDSRAWTERSFDLSAYAGMNVQLYLNVHQDGFGDLTSMYVDNIHFGASSAALISASLTDPDTSIGIDSGEGLVSLLGTATSSITVSATATLDAKAILYSGPIGTDLSTSSWWRFAVSGAITAPTLPDTPPDPLVKTATVRALGNIGDTTLEVQLLTGGIATGTVLYLGPDAVVTVVDFAAMNSNTLNVLPLTSILNVGAVLTGTPTYPSPPPPPSGGYVGPPPPPPSPPGLGFVPLRRTSIIMPTPVLDSSGRPS